MHSCFGTKKNKQKFRAPFFGFFGGEGGCSDKEAAFTCFGRSIIDVRLADIILVAEGGNNIA